MDFVDQEIANNIGSSNETANEEVLLSLKLIKKAMEQDNDH